MAEAERCQTKLQMAKRLVGALETNGIIWERTVETTGAELKIMPGDTLVACSFASYVGVFSRQYREAASAQFVGFLQGRGILLGPNPDPLTTLCTEAEQARWCAKGLPNDRVSLENGAIMSNSERWCLLIDPQAQGIVWVKNKEAGNRLHVVRMGAAKIVQIFEQAIDAGKSVLIESMGLTIDAVLQPVIARNVIKRGQHRIFKLGDKDIKHNSNFKLFMQTKLSNPHYPPEVHAECTIVNFTVTEQGLEDQILFLVVRLERPDLAKAKSELILQQNEYKVRLADLEALLLEKLATAEGDVLDDEDLIRGLEEVKTTSDEVKEKVLDAQSNEAKINETSEYYRPVAARGSLLFFLMMDLGKMHTFYTYSLEAFIMVVTQGINTVSYRKPKDARHSSMVEPIPDEVAQVLSGEGQGAQQDEEHVGDVDEEHEEQEIVELSEIELQRRASLLEGLITSHVFSYLRRGLLDADKLTVASMLLLRMLLRSNLIKANELNTLIRAPPDPHATVMPDNARTWLTELQWAQLKTLEQIPAFKVSSVALTQQLEQDSPSWKRWYADERAEAADLPRGCRQLDKFYRLFLLRVLRPDRIGAALTQFVIDNLGHEFVEQAPFNMLHTYQESTCFTPLLFILFPGIDPTSLVEDFARQLGMTHFTGRFVNISMGEGQEHAALNALNKAARDGGWIVLQNIHLMESWLRQLERTLELVEEFMHPDFRCILTSEPPSALQGPLHELIPEGILQKSIKVADEAPTDLKSNLRRAYAKFSQDHIEACAKPKEFKATLFALCFFHALISGRIKFGPQGWSRKYPFNDGDLTICAKVLSNYLDNAEQLGTEVPWPDLRYIFGDIMYGGHITDSWDRRVCKTYLEILVGPELLNNQTLAPGFKSPDASKMEYANYQKFIEKFFPAEQPQLFGMHPNAEIRFLTNQGSSLFRTIQNISGSSAGKTIGDIAASSTLITRYLEILPADLDTADVRSHLKEEDYTPYVITSLQESDRMNRLLGEVRGSLLEVELATKGQLNVTEGMERLSDSLQLNAVNDQWQKLAYPSLKSLSAWFADLIRRVEHLHAWTAERALLKSIWLSGLFNPMAFLTAIMQVTSRESSLPLDYMTNRFMFLHISDPSDILRLPQNGAHVHGLFMEGASWEEGKGDDEGYITESKIKELHPGMPVANVYSVHIEQMDWTNMYHCPVFITAARGSTFVVEVNLRMDPDDDEKHWILAGAALLMAAD